MRYRYDLLTKRRFKTVELLEEELPWEPKPAVVPGRHADTQVLIEIRYAETELRQRVKDAGGQWQPEQKLWKVAYAGVVVLLGLEGRVVG